jgi:trimeric autotransporter adhesin
MDNSIKILGDVELGGNLSFATNYSGFPANPKPRTLAVVNGQPYLYTELVNGSGYFSWTPIGYRQSAYVHTQGVAATTWTVTHNFNTTDFGFFVYDANHNLVLANVNIIDANSFNVVLTEAITGTVVVFSTESIFSETVSASATVKVGQVTLADAAGKLTVNNNAVAMQLDLSAEVTRAIASESTLTTALAAESTRALAAEAALSTRIDNVISNTDPVALDSLGKIVTAFQASDNTLNGAITSLSNSSAAAVAAETTRATAAEAAITANVSAETTRAQGAEAVLRGNVATLTAAVSAEVTRATAAETAIAATVTSEATTRATAISNLANTVSAETTRAEAAEGVLSNSIASEITARTTAVSAAIATAASDATAKVAAEAALRAAADTSNSTAIAAEVTRASAAEGVLTTNLTAETTARIAGDAATLTSAKSYTDSAIVSATPNLTAITTDIIPATTLTYNLGSLTHQFHSLYVGPGTVYINGVPVLGQNTDQQVVFSTSPNENLIIQTTGTGDIQLDTDPAGAVQVNGTLQIGAGGRIMDKAGVQVQFGSPIQMNNYALLGVPTPVNATDGVNKSYVDGLTTGDLSLVRTTGAQIIGGAKTFSGDVVISGGLTVSGNVTTINSTTIKLADNIIDLNSNFTSGTPTANAGVRVMRGDSPAAQIVWNEAAGKWEVSGDSSNFSVIATAADISTEANARVSGDAATLSSAQAFATAADTTVLSTAQSFATAAVNTEVSARNLAIATSLATAEAYTDSAITSEVNARNAAIAAIHSVASATTATKLATPVTINGVSFDGSASITITANASTLTGTLDGGSY